MKSAAVIYICSGGYKIFWKEFYLSSEKFFLPEIQKRYFVFTDSKEIIEEHKKNVQTFYCSHIGWPYDVLEKWSCICRVQDLLRNFDYIVLCNANMEFISEFRIDKLNKGDLTIWSTTVSDTQSSAMNHERNSKSKACIPLDAKTEFYYGSGFVFGKTEPFLKMSAVLRNWTEEDLSNGIIPTCHDESMLNAYVYHHPEINYSIIGPKEILSEEFVDKANEPWAIFRNKDRYGGNVGIRYNNRIIGDADILRRRILNKLNKICGQ